MAPTHELVTRQNDGGCRGGNFQACGSMDSGEKVYIAAGAGVCGAIVLSVGAILLYRRLRAKRRAKAAAAQDSMATPMMSSFNRLNAPSTFSFHAPNSPQPAVRPPASPLSSYHDGSGSSSSGGSSSSSHSVQSPMSDHSSAFHFPLLSKDGHLMPPVPASSWSILEGDLGSGPAGCMGRPLPLAPGEQYEQYEEDHQQYQYPQYTPDPYNVGPQAQVPVQLVAPTPSTPKRWSYVPPHSTPSPERSDESVQQIVGLYPSIDFRTGGQYDYGMDGASVRSSPRIARVEDTFGFHQPQSATYHRSFSAEGEELRADR